MRRSLLRESIRDDHQRLDDMIGLPDTAESYRRYVACVGGFRIKAEEALVTAARANMFGVWRPTCLTAAIAQDFEDLDLSPSPVDPLAEPHSVSEALGMAYVLEGSSLGAKFIAARASRLGYDGAFGARHLQIQAGASENWKNFTDLLEAVEDYQAETVCAAARRVFAHAQKICLKFDGTMAYG